MRPVRDASIAQKLRTIIDAKQMTMGDTREGGDWCIKALHPSDPLTEVQGIPDQSAVPSVAVNYQSTFTLEAPVGTDPTGSWGFNGTLFPHPINFGTFDVFDDAGTHSYIRNHLNEQLPGVGHAQKYTNFIANSAERWRLMYCSVTCYLDAAGLNNQGTLVACQAPLLPAYGSLAPPATVAGAPSGRYIATRAAIFTSRDMPDFNTSQAMPNAYFGTAKDGLYMPLKLTKTCQEWHSTADDNVVAGGIARKTSPNGGAWYPLWDDTDTLNKWPFYDLHTPGCAAATDTLSSQGDVTSALCNDTVGHFSAVNLHPGARLTLFYRYGFELQVAPQQSLTPFQKLSPRYDPRALETYFAISRELKDAYPEEFNSLGKIWEVIKGVAQTVLPVVSTMGPYGAAIGGAGSAALALGDRIKSALENGRNRPAPADVEIARRVVEPAQVPVPRPRKIVMAPAPERRKKRSSKKRLPVA